MFIIDFQKRFASTQEKSRLFDALRRLSRLDGRLFMAADDPSRGWPEWPPICPQLEKIEGAAGCR